MSRASASSSSAAAAAVSEFVQFPESPSYGVSHNGIIVRLKTGRVMKPPMSSSGYFNVRLCEKGIHRTFNVAYIVCRTFHGLKPTAKHTVDHINRIKTDNRADNLRWATRSEQGFNRVNVSPSVPNRRARNFYQLHPVTRDVIATFHSRKDAAKSVHESIGTETTRLATIGSNIGSAVKTGGIGYGFGWSADPLPVAPSVTDLEDEEWKEIPHANKHQSISNCGRISETDSGGRVVLVHCAETMPLAVANGYFKYMMNMVITPVHHLVAAAFIGPRPDHAIIRHLDGDKLNNHVMNMEYVIRAAKRKAPIIEADEEEEYEEEEDDDNMKKSKRQRVHE